MWSTILFWHYQGQGNRDRMGDVGYSGRGMGVYTRSCVKGGGDGVSGSTKKNDCIVRPRGASNSMTGGGVVGGVRGRKRGAMRG